MSKYSVHIESTDENGSEWTAQIVRHVTTKKQVVSKQQDGFGTQAQAEAWANEELKVFIKVEAGRKARRSK